MKKLIGSDTETTAVASEKQRKKSLTKASVARSLKAGVKASPKRQHRATVLVLKKAATAKGGAVACTIAAGDVADLIDSIRTGLPYETVSIVVDQFGLEMSEVRHVLGLAARTVARRKKVPKPLDSDQSERLVRIVQVLEFATEVLEDREKAKEWCTTPNLALNNERPMDLLDTGFGYEQVMGALRRIEFGVYN